MAEGPVVPVVLGALVNSLRGRFTIPQHVLFPTFRVVVYNRTAGDVTLKLRFGFENADADVATLGIDFATLAASQASDTRSPVWVVAAAAPNFVGNPNSILPPRVSVLLTTNAVTGFSGTYRLFYCGLIVP